MGHRALAVFKVAAVRDLGEGHRAVNLEIQPNDRFKDEYAFEMQAGEEITVYIKTPETVGLFELGAIVEMKIEPEFKI